MGLAVVRMALLAHWVGLAIRYSTKCRVALEGVKIAGNLLDIDLAKVASHTRETSEFNVFGRFSQGLCESRCRMSTEHPCGPACRITIIGMMTPAALQVQMLGVR